MKKPSDHSIEGQKLFPLFAWSILLMFSGFVFLLTLQLRDVANSLVTTATINAATFEPLNTAKPATSTKVSL